MSISDDEATGVQRGRNIRVDSQSRDELSNVPLEISYSTPKAVISTTAEIVNGLEK